jgi:hypothetical protein
LFIKAQAKARFKKEASSLTIYDLKPLDIFYLEDAFEKLCKEIRLVLSVKDLSSAIAYLILETAEKSVGKVPLFIRIMEQNEVFHSDFNNYKLSVDPEQFLKNITLPIEHKIELSS